MAKDNRAETNSTGNHQEFLLEQSMKNVDALKDLVRDGLLLMNLQEREAFINALEAELQGVHLSISSYLIPLGIPARKPDELTPVEAGHLVRFLMINVPSAAPTIERAMSHFSVFAKPEGTPANWLAA